MTSDCLQAAHLDELDVRVAAVDGVVDLVVWHGVDGLASQADSVVEVLEKLTGEAGLQLRTAAVEGLCRLLMAGATHSPGLLSSLLLLWYSPATQPASRLRHVLGTFFPLYCSLSSHNQHAIRQAFLPTITQLFEAPVSSPVIPSAQPHLLLSLT